jgi:hypothetical protein
MFSRYVVAVATIYSYDTDQYRPLGIMPGFNCLFVWVRGQYRAKMVPVSADVECKKIHTNPDSLVGKPLDVREFQAGAGYTDADYPPVARWDWDPWNRSHYMGIKCMSAWCEIGDFGFVTSPSHPAPPLPADARVWKIKGWYDEQHLAIASDGKLIPGPARGTVVPNPKLPTYDRDSLYSRQWKHVASMLLDRASPLYRLKLLLQGDSPDPARMTTLSFCKGTAKECQIANPPAAPESESWWSLWQADPWWGKITAPDGAVQYRYVVRRKHPGIKIPATARWRWETDDERMWVFCPEGCCEVAR